MCAVCSLSTRIRSPCTETCFLRRSVSVVTILVHARFLFHEIRSAQRCVFTLFLTDWKCIFVYLKTSRTLLSVDFAQGLTVSLKSENRGHVRTKQFAESLLTSEFHS